MEYFDKYVSNTLASTGNQSFFISDKTIQTCKLYYKVFEKGRHEYSFLFSNIIDSTYADGSISHKNLICEDWEIIHLKTGISKDCNPDNKAEMKELSFDGKTKKTVHPGEFFNTDPVYLEPDENSYICIELSYSGGMIPCHVENLIPSFSLVEGKWLPSKEIPVISMLGVSRCVKARIGYLGDSITQGIGTAENSYMHWNALLSEKLGHEYSYWNLGIGFGRAADAASDGAWLYKAKQTDITIVCYGVNDILCGYNAFDIKKNLSEILFKLKAAGNKVLLQTIPPFDYNDRAMKIWLDVNAYIMHELKNYADLVFDTVPILQENEKNPGKAKYNGHPNAMGCAVWAKSLYNFIKNNKWL